MARTTGATSSTASTRFGNGAPTTIAEMRSASDELRAIARSAAYCSPHAPSTAGEERGGDQVEQAKRSFPPRRSKFSPTDACERDGTRFSKYHGSRSRRRDTQ
jgi:hypothetical protein